MTISAIGNSGDHRLKWGANVVLHVSLVTVFVLSLATRASRRAAVSLGIAVLIGTGTTTLAAAQSDTNTDEREAGESPAADGRAWKPGDPESALPGLIPAPAEIAGVGRWQAMMMPIGGYVESAVFSPDGTKVAFGDGPYVRIHDAVSLDMTGVLVGHAGNVRSVAWSPDGKRLASGADDATVRIWGADGTPTAVMEEHLAPVRGVAWRPDGELLASCAMDGTVRLWGIDGTPGLVIDGHEAPVNSLAWSPDGQLLAAGDENRTVRLWTIKGQPGPVLQGHHGAITHVRWSPDGKWLASSSMGLLPTEPGQQPIATTRLWQPDGTPGPTLRGHSRAIRALAWSPDSDQLVTAGEDRQMLLWSKDGKLIRQVDQNNRDQGDVFSLDWNAAAERILAGGRNSVRFLTQDGPTGSQRLIRPRGGKLDYLDWNPTGDQIAIGSEDFKIHLWSGGFASELTIDAFDSPVGCVRWSPDGRQLASISFEDTVRIWNADGTLAQEFTSNRGVPRGLAWTHDGARLAVSRRGGETQIFDMDGTDVSFDFHNGGSGGVSFSPDGKKLATCGFDANVRVLQVDDLTQVPKELALMQAFDGDVDSIAWSPDGEWIASGHDTTLCFWRPDGTPGPVVPAAEAAIMRVDWSPDSQTVATGAWDKSVRLWNLDGDLIREFPGHTAPVWGTSFSPDGKQLGTCGWDGVARILDVETGRILAMALYVADPEPDPDGQGAPRHYGIAFNRAGQVTSGDPKVLEQQVAYLVEQPSGAFQVMKPSEFHAIAPGAILTATE